MVLVTAVDIEKHRSVAEKVIQKYGINVNGVPTIVLLKPKLDGSKELIVYNGERNFKSIVDFAVANMPSSVEVISATSYQKFLQKDSKPTTLLFSNKKTPGMILKALSTKYKQCKFALVHDSQKTLVQEFSVGEFPSLFVLPSGRDIMEEWKKYEGKFSYLSLDLFLMDYCKTSIKKEL
jgi:hypothetical protein